jgi:hypothetical protein
MLNKKGYMITPILFIVFLLIAMIFSFYVSDIDKANAKSITLSASIDKGVADIYKEQINQFTYAKNLAYDCSEITHYSAGNESTIETCINNNMTARFNDTSWNSDITNPSSIYTLGINLTSMKSTNINMTSDRVYLRTVLNSQLFKTV